MYQWGQSGFSGRWLFLAAALVVTLMGCRSSDERACLSQGKEDNVDALVRQRLRAGGPEKAFATEFMQLARESEARAERLGKHWGGAGKAWGEALSCYPTVESLVGYAYVNAMMGVSQPTPRETLDAKIRFLRKAADTYRAAVALSPYTGEPVPEDVPAKIRCIETFLADPDPHRPPCQLIENAMRTSGITGEPRRFYNHHVEG